MKSLVLWLPPARTLRLYLVGSEVLLILMELWHAGMEILTACFLIYLSRGAPAECNHMQVPTSMFWQAFAMLCNATSTAVLIYPTHTMMAAAVHVAMVCHYRALGKNDLAREEQANYVNKEKKSLVVAIIGTVMMSFSEIIQWISWIHGMRHSFGATLECGGPIWFQTWALKPAPVLFLFPAIGLFIWFLRHSRKFLYQQIFLSESKSPGSPEIGHWEGASPAAAITTTEPDIELGPGRPNIELELEPHQANLHLQHVEQKASNQETRQSQSRVLL